MSPRFNLMKTLLALPLCLQLLAIPTAGATDAPVPNPFAGVYLDPAQPSAYGYEPAQSSTTLPASVHEMPPPMMHEASSSSSSSDTSIMGHEVSVSISTQLLTQTATVTDLQVHTALETVTSQHVIFSHVTVVQHVNIPTTVNMVHIVTETAIVKETLTQHIVQYVTVVTPTTIVETQPPITSTIHRFVTQEVDKPVTVVSVKVFHNIVTSIVHVPSVVKETMTVLEESIVTETATHVVVSASVETQLMIHTQTVENEVEVTKTAVQHVVQKVTETQTAFSHVVSEVTKTEMQHVVQEVTKTELQHIVEEVTKTELQHVVQKVTDTATVHIINTVEVNVGNTETVHIISTVGNTETVHIVSTVGHFATHIVEVVSTATETVFVSGAPVEQPPAETVLPQPNNGAICNCQCLCPPGYMPTPIYPNKPQPLLSSCVSSAALYKPSTVVLAPGPVAPAESSAVGGGEPAPVVTSRVSYGFTTISGPTSINNVASPYPSGFSTIAYPQINAGISSTTIMETTVTSMISEFTIISSTAAEETPSANLSTDSSTTSTETSSSLATDSASSTLISASSTIDLAPSTTDSSPTNTDPNEGGEATNIIPVEDPQGPTTTSTTDSIDPGFGGGSVMPFLPINTETGGAAITIPVGRR
ncbi:hypothetical protein H072_5567 [Dactylellina haptotyla CBS 200.50]|uniref:Uncharacterized protein n=1 Tax=Dactylellina haptotyla (strain CBS 200.50) TaxID=1284197 RepID=S8AC63_DACHA|nr:hypothetical protein H072_5567 [Dactylellina haptotyla CBS 200.50]